MKPSLFIASSVEGLNVAYAVQENLQYDAEPTVWPQGVFDLSRNTLASLVSAAKAFDYAIFVFTYDDVTRSREKEFSTVRDNVLFELGLFIGGIGLDRSFIVTPRDAGTAHLPSDLGGLTLADYDAKRADKNLVAALGPACNRIRQIVKLNGVRPREAGAQSEALLGFHDRFRAVPWESLLARASKRLDVVVYYFDSWVNAHYESLVAYFERPETRVRIFVADPRREDVLANVVRLYPEYSRSVIEEKIAHTHERFARALSDAGGTPDRLELRYVPHVLNYAAQCVDDQILVLSFFDMFRQMRIDAPALIVDLERSEPLGRFWRKELDGLLNGSIDPRVSPSPSSAVD